MKSKESYGYLIEFTAVRFHKEFMDEVVPRGYKKTWCPIYKRELMGMFGHEVDPDQYANSSYYLGHLPEKNILLLKMRHLGIKRIWRVDVTV
ncbi:conserved protein of unknown function [Magnetospirillum sp. XM-1]|uniref:hypothetical protein n=1 Tax=Magnetospirillum sp. XM-1 TaxID=1663591 RepID=UPI00073E0D37|nr:hypothetical protein [Magnetospirillum sp. XM-1]CUW38696.1 conserved protein of unknown function [Magnetospirillum sp. XM-1]